MSGVMEGIVVTGPGKFEYRDNLPIPQPGPGEVLVRVSATGICGTDLHITAGDETFTKLMKPPVVLGHEFCGIVEECGAGVTKVSAGDYVSAEMHRVCMKCPACLDGKYHVCSNTQIQGIHIDGCFAEFVVIPEWNVIALPESVPVKIGAILDAVGNAVHTSCKAPLKDRSVAVFGFGPIGAMAAEIVLFSGASRVFVIDVSPRALSRARHWAERKNATDKIVVIDGTTQNPVDVVRAETVSGCDISLEFSGAPSGINSALESVRAGGEVSLLGFPKDSSVMIKDYSSILWKGLTLHGIAGRELFRTWETMIDLIDRGLDLTAIVTAEYPLKNFADALERFRAGEEQKVVLYPGQ